MKISRNQLLFVCAAVCCIFSCSEACQHSLHEGERLRRDIRGDVEVTAGLRAYFTACMSLMVPLPSYDWSATVDYTVLESLWHLNTAEVYCGGAGGGSTQECWQEKIATYLNADSILLPASRTCIAHYSEDEPLGLNRYQNYTKRVERQAVRHRTFTLDLELPRYAECLSSTVTPVTIAPDYELLSFFIRNDTQDPCDFGPMENREIPTWPYRFVALTRSDRELRRQINTCGKIVFPPKPFLSSWSRYGECRTDCRQTRTRTCRSGAYQGRVASGCNGRLVESRGCSGGQCRNTQSWVGWSSWSECIPPCKDGKQSRTRTCQYRNGTMGIECSGGSIENRPCRGGGVYSSWKGWDSCTPQCVQERVRLCEWRGRSYDVLTQERKCLGGRCLESTPDPQWSSWSELSVCKRTCQPEQRTRRRTCRSHLGAVLPASRCRGNSEETVSCRSGRYTPWSLWVSATCPASCMRRRIRTCPGTNIRNTQTRSCRGGACTRGYSWGRWSSYDSCSVTCGRGRQTRRRHCVLKELDNTRGVNRLCLSQGGSNTSSRSCNTERCPSWSSWSSYGRCRNISVNTCFTGTQTRTRTCRNGTSSQRCKGNRLSSRRCPTTNCIPVIR